MRQPTLTTTTAPLRRLRAARRLAVLTFRDAVCRDVFEAQLDRVLRSTVPVSLGQVEQALAGGPPLPAHAALLTFESGHRSVVTEALPVLARHGVPGLAFVVAELVDTDRPYWWDEADYLAAQGGRARCLSGPWAARGGARAALAALPDPDRRRSLEELRVTARHRAPGRAQLTSADLRTLLDAGIAIGNHSLGHASLAACDGYELRQQIVGGHERLTRLTGTAPTAFAYPDDTPDARATDLLRELGYRTAFLTDGHLVDAVPATDSLSLSRVLADPATPRHHHTPAAQPLRRTPWYRRPAPDPVRATA